MKPRTCFAPEERAARSRLAQVLHEREFICGSIVSMARRCGKPTCHCVSGSKHASMYLSALLEGKRRLIYIPTPLEEEVKRRVALYQELQQLTQRVSAACLNRVLLRKQEHVRHG